MLLRRDWNLFLNVRSPVFLNFLYKSSLRLISLRMLWVIQGSDDLLWIVLFGIHFEAALSIADTKSDQSSSTVLWLRRSFYW